MKAAVNPFTRALTLSHQGRGNFRSLVIVSGTMGGWNVSSFVIEFSKQAPRNRLQTEENMEGKVQIEITYCVP